MQSEGSITHWIGQLKAGDQAAAQDLWERYFKRLVGLARKKLEGTPRRAADEEDVALSAFDSFCRGVERGRFPKLQDRDDLWPLLVVITARKACDLAQHERREKRAGAILFSDLPGADGLSSFASDPAVQQIIGTEPTPAFAAQIADECRRLLDLLPDAELRSVAIWKMEGYTNDEIAARLQCVPRTVERKLRVIRSVWDHGGGS
jgi:DNA-directed RNA polymerase specialized sigma24 family protein